MSGMFVAPILCGLCNEPMTRTKQGYLIYSGIYDTVEQELVACHPQCVKAAKTILEEFMGNESRYNFSQH